MDRRVCGLKCPGPFSRFAPRCFSPLKTNFTASAFAGHQGRPHPGGAGRANTGRGFFGARRFQPWRNPGDPPGALFLPFFSEGPTKRPGQSQGLLLGEPDFGAVTVARKFVSAWEEAHRRAPSSRWGRGGNRREEFTPGGSIFPCGKLDANGPERKPPTFGGVFGGMYFYHSSL